MSKYNIYNIHIRRCETKSFLFPMPGTPVEICSCQLCVWTPCLATPPRLIYIENAISLHIWLFSQSYKHTTEIAVDESALLRKRVIDHSHETPQDWLFIAHVLRLRPTRISEKMFTVNDQANNYIKIIKLMFI